MPDLKGKVAVITGATGGLGRAVALRMAADGARVVVNGRNAAAGGEVVRAIRGRGGEAHFIRADMLSKAEARDMVREAIDHFGVVDIMVASAGAPALQDGRRRKDSGVFADIDPDDIAEAVARQTLIKLNPVHAVAAHMIARRSGAILFITSEGGRVPTPGQTSVALFSGGLIMMTKVVAKELARHRIRVNTLSVTLVKNTPAWDRYAGGNMSELRRAVFDKISKAAPFGLAEPEDIAAVAATLVSGDAGFITGATVSATGGATYP